ncbi:MAG: ABC transporter ATP-binding protein [Mesorhizobium sp.]
MQPGETPLPEQTATQTVALENIHKRYGAMEVLHGVSLRANEGEVVSILGSSGSGKSTLLRCINMLEVPNRGTVTVSGETIELHQPASGTPRPANMRQVERLRSRIGMVFQSFNLWSHRTIVENIVEGPVHVQGRSRSECLAEAEALLQRVGIYDKKDRYPSQLSGGQQQRAAIARALAMRPQLMLFDEPTSALDPELVGEVLKVMRSLAEEGRTMLIVTHEIGFAREVSDRIVFLHNGLVEEDGTPSDVFENSRSDRFRKFISRER